MDIGIKLGAKHESVCDYNISGIAAYICYDRMVVDLFYFSLFYFLPYNVSSGIAAAKYFLFYFILILYLNKNRALNYKI